MVQETLRRVSFGPTRTASFLPRSQRSSVDARQFEIAVRRHSPRGATHSNGCTIITRSLPARVAGSAALIETYSPETSDNSPDTTFVVVRIAKQIVMKRPGPSGFRIRCPTSSPLHSRTGARGSGHDWISSRFR